MREWTAVIYARWHPCLSLLVLYRWRHVTKILIKMRPLWFKVSVRYYSGIRFSMVLDIYIVACQQGRVSNEPPWLRAATRHRARDPLGPLTGGRYLTPTGEHSKYAKYLNGANPVTNHKK